MEKDVNFTWDGVNKSQDDMVTLYRVPIYILKNPSNYDRSDNHIEILRNDFVITFFTYCGILEVHM